VRRVRVGKPALEFLELRRAELPAEVWVSDGFHRVVSLHIIAAPNVTNIINGQA
jgi:hypothetical protein